MKKISHDSETPAHGQQVITVTAFIYRKINNKVELFLPRRALSKKFLPGVYELPGGHVEFGEELKAGLAREIKEELRMNISIGDCFAAFTYLNHVKGSHSVEIVFFAQFTSPLRNLSLRPEDHSEYAWFSEDTIENALLIGRLADDPEITVIRKGFTILKGNSLSFH